jgi:hypothetical protein
LPLHPSEADLKLRRWPDVNESVDRVATVEQMQSSSREYHGARSEAGSDEDGKKGMAIVVMFNGRKWRFQEVGHQGLRRAEIAPREKPTPLAWWVGPMSGRNNDDCECASIGANHTWGPKLRQLEVKAL